MAVFNKFDQLKEDIGLKVHNFDTDTLKVYLTNAAPSASGDAVKADLAEIAAGNGYTAGGADVSGVWSEAAGVATLVGTDIVWTATTGSIGPFRYAVLYNDTSPSDSLIGWWDYGSPVTAIAAQTITVDFGASILQLS